MKEPNRIISRAPQARGKFLRRAALLTVAVLAAVAPARACDTPVYRYAMTNWQADAFEAFVFHRGPLDEPTKAAMTRLESVANGEVPINLMATAIDVDGDMAGPIGEIWQWQKPSRMPWLVVMPPLGPLPDERSLYAGPLEVSAVEALADSSARRDIARRLRSGDAIVWVLLAGKDPAQNAAARAAVTAASEDVLKSYVPPDAAQPSGLTEGEGDDAQVDPEFQRPPEEPLPPPRFSVVELSRADPAEAMLRTMLLRSEPDLAARAGEEVVAFPLFGRGRSLTGLVGGDITADSVTKFCQFLLGPCSCEVKERNPGVDLLIRTDWETPLSRDAQRSELGAADPLRSASRLSGQDSNLLRNLLVAVAFIVAAAGAVALVARRRARRS